MNQVFKIVLAIGFILIGSLLQAQMSIFDSSGKPLPFAHIIISGSQNNYQLQTDAEGQLTLPNKLLSESPPFEVLVSYIGYKTYRDTLDSINDIEIVIVADRVALDQVVVTAQYDHSTLDNSINKVKVITQERMQAQGAVSLKDVLTNETNIRISQDNILGSSMSMQGVSGQNVKILIDGVPVIGRLNGNVDLSQININDIEHIEVVEGPLSVNYGTDALAGTINLITKKGQKQKFNVNLNTYYETVGQYNIDGRIGIKLKKNQLSISGGRYYFDGWNPSDPFIEFPKERIADSLRSKQWNPKKQYFAKAQYLINRKKMTIRPYIEYYDETITNKGFPRAPYGKSAIDEYYNTSRINGGIDLKTTLCKTGNLNIVGAYNYYNRAKNVYFKDLTTLENTRAETLGNQDTTKFSIFMSRGNYTTQKDSSKFNFELGYDINYETAEGKRLGKGKRNQGDYALFGSLQWKPITSLTIKPSLRIVHNTVYKTPIVPSINAMHKLKKMSFRASYARGFRAPGLKELYFEFVDVNHNIMGNPELTAEESNNYSINANWKRLTGKSIYKIGADIFYNDIFNLISLVQVQTTSAYTYKNIGRFKTLGVQLNGEFIREKFKFNLGGSYIGRQNDFVEKKVLSNFSFSPEIRSSITYKFPKLKSSISLFYKYNGKLPIFTLNSEDVLEESIIDNYSLLDISANKYFWKKRISWTIGVKNLFNVQNINVSGASVGTHSTSSNSNPVAWGTTIFTSLKFNFNWK